MNQLPWIETTKPEIDMRQEINIKTGEYLIIRADGTEQLFTEKPNFRKLHEQLKCDTFDTVVLEKLNGEALIVMLADDTGMINNEPVNHRATTLYHLVKPQSKAWSIHGDVAIVNDRDFQ